MYGLAFREYAKRGLKRTIILQRHEIKSVLTSGVIGLLTGLSNCQYHDPTRCQAVTATYPHHTSFSEPGSFTIRLSKGERPVFAPEYAVRAPVEVMAEPVS